MLKIYDVDVVGIRKITTKEGKEILIVYFMCDNVKDVEGIFCGQMFFNPKNKSIKRNEKLRIVWSGKGWDYVE